MLMITLSPCMWYLSQNILGRHWPSSFSSVVDEGEPNVRKNNKSSVQEIYMPSHFQHGRMDEWGGGGRRGVKLLLIRTNKMPKKLVFLTLSICDTIKHNLVRQPRWLEHWYSQTSVFPWISTLHQSAGQRSMHVPHSENSPVAVGAIFLKSHSLCMLWSSILVKRMIRNIATRIITTCSSKSYWTYQSSHSASVQSFKIK